jgi:Na+-driven multidrug efflux pump
MAINVGILLMVTVPLAYLLPKVGDLGVYGVRWAMVSGMVLPAIAFTIYFRSGRWKSRVP